MVGRMGASHMCLPSFVSLKPSISLSGVLASLITLSKTLTLSGYAAMSGVNEKKKKRHRMIFQDNSNLFDHDLPSLLNKTFTLHVCLVIRKCIFTILCEFYFLKRCIITLQSIEANVVLIPTGGKQLELKDNCTLVKESTSTMESIQLALKNKQQSFLKSNEVNRDYCSETSCPFK